MSAPINFSWKMDCEGTRNTDSAHAARIAAAQIRLAAEVKQAPAPAEEKPFFVRIGWRLKIKEWFRPSSTRTRAYEEFLRAQAIPDQPDQAVEQSNEPASLPGAALQKLREQDEELLPTSSVDEVDPDMTRDDYTDQSSALPFMPDDQREASVGSSEVSHAPTPYQSDEEPSLEDLMDDALDALDAPGNRCSVRSPLPPEWRAVEFSRMSSSRLAAQQEARRSTEYLPLPSAVFEAGEGHLPNLSTSRTVPNFSVTSSRPGKSRIDSQDGEECAQATPASGRWFRSARRN